MCVCVASPQISSFPCVSHHTIFFNPLPSVRVIAIARLFFCCLLLVTGRLQLIMYYRASGTSWRLHHRKLNLISISTKCSLLPKCVFEVTQTWKECVSIWFLNCTHAFLPFCFVLEFNFTCLSDSPSTAFENHNFGEITSIGSRL